MSRNTVFKLARTIGVLAFMLVALSMLFVPPTLAQGPKPPAPKDSVSVTATDDMKKLVAELSKALGLTDVAYEAWRSPSDTIWEETFKYYSIQMNDAGWSGQGMTKEFDGGKLGVWVNQETKTALVLIFIAPTKADPAVHEIAVFGKLTDAPAAPPAPAASATPAAPAKGAQNPKPAPPKDSVSVTATKEMDALTTEVAKALGLTDVIYEAWRSPSDTVWEETFKFYSNQMADAGWSGQGTTKEFDGGKLGVWINQETQTALVLIFIVPTKTDPAVYEIALFGKLPGATSAQPTVKGNVPTTLPKMTGLPDAPTMKNAAPNPKLPAPKEAVAKQNTPELEKTVDDFAVSVKWKKYDWGVWDVPATVTWNDVYKYYSDLLAQLNIKAVGVTKDFNGGNVGVWVDDSGGMIVIFAASPDGKTPATVLLAVGN